ncbi:MAG: Rne/Rng family ribonuclease [Armatimonadetes bacterium]|nr:Rne/Rng family ribonuclease [Armatimonadota bacterium]
MSKEIIVNVDTRETRVALVESGRLVELNVEREERVVGSIYKSKVSNVLAGMDAAFVDIGLERNAFLYVADVLPEMDDEFPSARKDTTRHVKIKDVLKVGQEVLVQVVKGPRGTKGCRVSTRISLPGRYLVLMPEADNLGVSRKIESESERDRLKKIGDSIRPSGFGLIIRTEAEGRNDVELRKDLDFLLRMWSQIQEKSTRIPAPGLVHQDLSLIYKTIRDIFSSDISRMIMDSPVDYEKALELIDLISPKMRSRLILYDEPEPIFERYAVEAEIESLLRRKVWLKSGGHLAIDSTEALTTIDVNTGKFVGSTSLSDTIVKTNLDAVTEIARQLRLRDIGGIIVLDFIDMANAKDRQKVVSALEKELRNDRTRTKISHISPLGLIEMTRKRTGETITELVTETCPYCQGRGRVESAETVSLEIERQLRRASAESQEDAFLITANPDVAFHLIGSGGEVVEEIERRLKRAIYVRSDEHLHIEKFDIAPSELQEMEKHMFMWEPGDTVDCEVVRNPLSALPRASAWLDGGYLVDLENGGKYVGKRVNLKLKELHRSFAIGEVVQSTKAEKQGR